MGLAYFLAHNQQQTLLHEQNGVVYNEEAR